jgi:preprotein translocase subunit SecA
METEAQIEGFADLTKSLRQQIAHEGMTKPVTEEAFALVAACAKQTLGLEFYDEQLFGGWVMHHGALAEMQTGEGKTLTATLPAAVAALAGVPVHVITTNDYLVERDAEQMGPLYANLGLCVATITEPMNLDERRHAYTADVVYVSNKQIVFDYLKDLQSMGTYPSSLRGRLQSSLIDPLNQSKPVMRGLCFAIIDEADSVLIDDAQTPLILSAPKQRESAAEGAVALGLARQLCATEDYLLYPVDRRIELTAQGDARLEEMVLALTGRWRNRKYRSERISQALAALYVYQLAHHYIVRESKIVLIDENTGRAMPDRTLSRGLHQMLEIKEGCEITDHSETLARLSYQQFFRRYFTIAGMTGTTQGISSEMLQVYNLPTVKVPTHARNQRKNLGVQVFARDEQKMQALLARIQFMREQGRPVLVGTRSVAESEAISSALNHIGTPHRVLNARQDADEAEIVAQAGQRSRITISTNMAGRGTDIPLGDGVAQAGGLHVICAHINDARRVDHQLYGRSARQGDPGSYEALVSLDDAFFNDSYPAPVKTVLGRMVTTGRLVRTMLSASIARVPQRWRERRSSRLRAAVLHQEERFFDFLAYARKE